MRISHIIYDINDGGGGIKLNKIAPFRQVLPPWGGAHPRHPRQAGRTCPPPLAGTAGSRCAALSLCYSQHREYIMETNIEQASYKNKRNTS